MSSSRDMNGILNRASAVQSQAEGAGNREEGVFSPSGIDGPALKVAEACGGRHPL
ncbi:hypothetical protein [Microbulbifer sp. ARAS458-1]|uniref:hypothetical protein n=1 Tax=Microbulbifer sp. ARAS458-1 TaxID=3140242 RepID=UPI003877C262